MTTFTFHQSVPVVFGEGVLTQLPTMIQSFNGKKGLIISTKSMIQHGIVATLQQQNPTLIDVFYDIQPNPTVDNTQHCVDMLRSGNYDFAVALGGGSVLDAAKVAVLLAPTKIQVQQYFDGTALPTAKGLPIIAIPTTAGTASEITKVSVLTDTVSGRKAPLNSPLLYATTALVDPVLTLSCTKNVTATSGIDVLAHALEALYSKHHQPFTDLFALHAAKLVFTYLTKAYDEPDNLAVRTKMAEASVSAGMAFNLTGTAAAHACSYPLTEQLNVPHGEACAFTLPKFWVYNATHSEDTERLHDISRQLGFEDAAHVAEAIEQLKRHLGLRHTWEEIGVETDEQLQAIVDESFTGNMQNNPVDFTKASLRAFYETISRSTQSI
ncbi:iron-containing alcohol dehydrogenase family protein [Kurthia massiliensis]|uniref:iron-containing alcohol dehydrogenase family protein n=1 Tax=Kurthia massiliensis TaxID=1033739 RepID=UPI0002895FD7|nr:iron-containing alcohol dehydrogenase family protein [Kurthia massiliensis]